jgi:hypothetical protein
VRPPPPPPDETELEKAMSAQTENIAESERLGIDLARSRRMPVRVLLLGKPPFIFHLLRGSHLSRDADAAVLIYRQGKYRTSGFVLFSYSLFEIRQGESGKSTILKNLLFDSAPIAFTKEILACREVVHLNLVCTVNRILDLLAPTSPAQPRDGSESFPRNGFDDPRGEATDEIKRLRMRLRPLREVETILSKRLATGGSPGRQPPRQEQTAEVGRIITVCREDIISLWENEAVQSMVVNHEEFRENMTAL